MPTGNLPAKPKKQWENVYNSAKKSGDDPSTAARKAWGAVKAAGWRKSKKSGQWVHRSDFIHSFSMFINKASFSDGLMRWSAVNSDTEWDLYKERMSLGLYDKMLTYIEDNVPPPAQYKSLVCSDFWCGGMPYLSISHYPDFNGKAVPGEVLELFIDGNQLKAKGILFDNAYGKEVWKSLKADEIKPKDSNRIRISIAFLDLAHKHGEGGNIYHRLSLAGYCPECHSGEGNKIYVDGYLVHLALTRVPVNPRTLMEAQYA